MARILRRSNTSRYKGPEGYLPVAGASPAEQKGAFDLSRFRTWDLHLVSTLDGNSAMDWPGLFLLQTCLHLLPEFQGR